MNCTRLCAPLSALLLTASAAIANDGSISYGGSPRLLSSHPSVRMESEVIRMTIGEETVTVDCRFVFRNAGKFCKVRMGFPDGGAGAVPSEENPSATNFLTFRSYVDGKEVKTEKLFSAQDQTLYHAKQVTFRANALVRVHDIYTVPVGSQITQARPNLNGVLHQAKYVLFTGSSWKDTIGKTEIYVAFKRKRPTLPLKPQPLARDTENRTLYESDWTGAPERIYWRGFAEPVVKESTLYFVRTNWKPTKRSDLYLAFDHRLPETKTP